MWFENPDGGDSCGDNMIDVLVDMQLKNNVIQKDHKCDGWEDGAMDVRIC